LSNVTLSIGGRSYTVACAAGEEDHVAHLGAAIDAKLVAMGDRTGQSESRALLFAALLLADELHEAKAGQVAQSSRVDLAPGLLALAGRLENLAARLEDAAASA
jgi:cell division protein ZapA